MTTGSEAKPAIGVTTGSGPPESGQLTSAGSACDPLREVIEAGLSQGRNAMAIWQDLLTDYGFAGGYQSVKRFVRKLRGAQTPEARAVIVTAPGEEAQIR